MVVEVIVNALPAQAPVPTWLPRTAMLPAAVALALQRLAVMVGNDVVSPEIQTMKAPKLGTFGKFVAVSVIGHGK